MTIASIYEKYGIPQNLANHMLLVAAVVKFIQRSWIGTTDLDWLMLVKIALLHDLGNVVKFTWDNPSKFGISEAQALKLKMLQNLIKEKYGVNDHEATLNMLTELNVDNFVKETILNKEFGNSVHTAISGNWYSKILHYSDMRVMPDGICTLEKRMLDVRDRYPKYANREDFSDLVKACHELEVQIQENMDVPIKNISDSSIKIDTGLLNINL